MANVSQNDLQSNNDILISLANDASISLPFSKSLNAIIAQDIIDLTLQHISLEDIQSANIIEFKRKYKNVFSVWIISEYLELQLKPNHKPYTILAKWDSMLIKYGHSPKLVVNSELVETDQPILSFQRNVFSDVNEERNILLPDMNVLRLLYDEAKVNVLEGRYPATNDYIRLAALQAAIDLGPYDQHKHTIEYFRQNIHKFISVHSKKEIYANKINGIIRTLSGSHWSYCAQQIVSHYKQISKNESVYDFLRQYMGYCWDYPYYGSAFFSGQIEKQVKGLASLLDHFDVNVWVAINSEGVHIINKKPPELLLTVGYSQLLYEIGEPKDPTNPDCIPCIFIYVRTPDESNQKILQIFSRQTKLMDQLISSFLNDINKNEAKQNIMGTDTTDGCMQNAVYSRNKATISRTNSNLKKLSFAEFDKKGHCINKSGSWLKK